MSVFDSNSNKRDGVDSFGQIPPCFITLTAISPVTDIELYI